jgi:dTMP kinase
MVGVKALRSLTVHTLHCSDALAATILRIAGDISSAVNIRHYQPAPGTALPTVDPLLSPSAAFEKSREKSWVECCLSSEPLIPVLEAAECLISDCPLGPMSPHVYHALYRQEIPVLCLRNPSGEAAWPLAEQRCRHPLYEDPLTLQVGQPETAVETFLLGFATEKRGKLIVVEGGDGAGKQTQCLLLLNRLRAEGLRAESLDFPHDAGHCGDVIRILLSGKIGGLREVNPLLFAALYSMNRYDKLPWIKYWLQRGVHVVMDRYMSANFGHQASKYSTTEERNQVIGVLRTFETQWLRLPPADMVLYLNLPPLFAWKALQADTTRVMLDMHEKAGIDYKTNVQKAFLWCCEAFRSEGWREIPCVDETETTRRSREELHESIYGKVKVLIGGGTNF